MYEWIDPEMVGWLSTLVALGVVNTIGDVWPVAPGVLIPTGQYGVDADQDEVADWIDSQGNSARLGLADPTAPAGSGNFPGSYEWDDGRVWVNYDTPQNTLAGQFGFGHLEINGGSALRRQHLVLGGVSNRNGGTLTLSTAAESGHTEDLDTPPIPQLGHGVLTVTGVGSVYNNHPKLIPADLQQVLGYEDNEGVGTLYTSLGTVITPSAGIPVTERDNDGHFDLSDGDTGRGELNILAGGRVEIGNRLIVGQTATGRGAIWIDGTGSHLHIGHTEAALGSATEAMRSTISQRSRLVLSGGGSIEINDAAPLHCDGGITVEGAGVNAIDGPLELDGVLVLKCGSILDGLGEITGTGVIALAANTSLNKPVNGPRVYQLPGGLPPVYNGQIDTSKGTPLIA